MLEGPFYQSKPQGRWDVKLYSPTMPLVCGHASFSSHGMNQLVLSGRLCGKFEKVHFSVHVYHQNKTWHLQGKGTHVDLWEAFSQAGALQDFSGECCA